MTHPTPVAASERMDSVDLVRGYALLGVLLMNVQYWFRNPPEPYWMGLHPFPGALNRAADNLLRFWFDTKSVTLFSMLFAFGLCVQWDRVVAKGHAWGTYVARRLGAMLLFGVLHIVLLWNGDILHWYAICGLLVLPFLGREVRTVRRWASAALALVTLAFLAAGIRQMLAPLPPQPHHIELQALGQACIQGYQQTSWLAVMRFRLQDYTQFTFAWSRLTLVIFFFVNFLIGIWVWKGGLLRDPDAHSARLGRFAAWMLALGMALSLVSTLQLESAVFIRAHWDRMRFFMPLFALAKLAAQILALGIGAGLVWLWTKPAWKGALRPLMPVGRMAFTNYILQSVVSTFVFYGWGLGYYNRVGPAAGIAYSLALFGLQIPLSAWWLARYRFGPLEWLWRCLTYGEYQPFRLRPAEA